VAELRSFLIGVVVAGVLLGIVAIALGAFSDDDGPRVAARLLTSPTAGATTQATSGPETTVIPTLAPTTQPSPTAEATEAPGAEPTAAPTDTPEPEPTADPVNQYLAVIQPIVGDLDVNIEYVIGQGSANPSGSTQAANTILGLAGRMGAASPPACLSSANATLVQGANEAAAAANQLIAALSASDSGATQAALSAMGVARNTLGQGAAAVSSAAC
jgi:hypothetical protein